MKQTNTFIVLRNKKGLYLNEFKNNEGRLAYSAGWAKEVGDVLKIPEEFYHGKDHEKYLAMAIMFDAEPIKVQAEYTLTTLDGEEPAEPVKDDDDLNDFFEKLLSSM